jgi:hypothetical protein
MISWVLVNNTREKGAIGGAGTNKSGYVYTVDKYRIFHNHLYYIIFI